MMIGLGLLGWFTHYLWNNVPYTVVYKHFTVSEYVNRKFYLHSPFLANFSYIESRNYLIYYFSMLYGIS